MTAGSHPLVAHVGQQRQMACALDGLGQGALVNGTGAGHAAGQDLGALGDISPQLRDILIIDRIRSVHAELADLFMLLSVLIGCRGSF